ncbi:YcxB family protein [Asticcacaulis tiandongensis]|uniref:YcxB family protein n=1 Tax=Asticcacaulis tiandongensis TaxID=2565365 RepID=UPI0011295C3D|nr:YcxB family protein [Asticcacaulis tiandongensis]
MMTTTQPIHLPAFRLTLKDYVEYSLDFLPRHYSRPASWLMFTPVPTVLGVIGAFKINNHNLMAELTLLALLMLAAFFIMAFVTITICLVCSLLNFRNMPNAKHDAHIQLSDEDLAVDLNHQEARFRWIGIHTVVTTRHLILAYVTPAAAVIIPKRIFATATDQEAFITRMQRLWQENRPI